MAGIDLVNFPNSKMGAAIAAGTSRFRVYGTDTTRFPNSKMGNAVALGVSRFLSLQVTGPPVAPSNLTPPVIAGTTVSGQTLISTRGTWSGSSATYSYQWKRGATNVGTNSPTYTLVAADIGSNITCVVTATNVTGFASATSNVLGPVTSGAPVNTGVPVISGGTQVGQTVTTTDGTWTSLLSLTYTYQWKRGVTNVGAGLNNYVLAAADIGSNITCVVTATNTEGSANATSNALGPVTAVPPSNSILPVISGYVGSPDVGDTLVTTTGTWSGTPTITYSYQWKSGVTNVGTNANSYTLVMADLGATMTVVVTATNAAGPVNATSAATPAVVSLPVNTALPTILGTPTQGQIISTTNGTWLGTATILYDIQWLRNGVAISGGVGSNYILVAADIGTMISAQVTAHNSIGSANATSTAIGPIAVAVGAIVLSWTTGSTDNTPSYSLDLPVDIANGDIVILEEADNAGFTGGILDTTNIGPLSGDPIAMTSVTVTDGTWYARARVQRGAGYGPYSNVVTVTIDTTAPTITSSATFSQLENAAFSTTLTASETVTWTKTGGADSALFTLTGAVLSMTAKDFEIPVDADANNTYIVQVTATDSVGLTTNQTITVTITDVIEGGAPRQFIIANQYVNIGGVRSYITAAGYMVET